MIKNPLKSIVNFFLLGYLFGLLSKVYGPFETVSIIFYLIDTSILILYTFKSKNQLLITILVLSIYFIIQKPYFLNDNIRMLNNLMLLFLPPIKLFKNKQQLSFLLFLLLLFIVLDFVFVFFPRDLSVKNDALGLFRSGNEIAPLAILFLLFYRSTLSNIALLVAGLLSSVKIIIVLALYRIIKKFKIIIVVIVPFVGLRLFNLYLELNSELKYLIFSGEISIISIITSFRYDRMLQVISESSLIDNKYNGYFEMDIFDVYFSLSFLGLIVAIVIYYNLYKILFRINEKIIFFFIFSYSVFFGHILFSTSLGLLILAIKHLYYQKSNDFFKSLSKEIKSFGFSVVSEDFKRPWGGFLVIDESQAQEFSNKFFDGINVNTLKIGGKLSPKILIVKPNARLSWQYHNRRAEIWQVYKGTVGIIRSDSDKENEMKVYKEGEQVVLQQGERHRLIGLDDYGVVAEIWQHTESDNPSDEDDIIRVQDDFGR